MMLWSSSAAVYMICLFVVAAMIPPTLGAPTLAFRSAQYKHVPRTQDHTTAKLPAHQSSSVTLSRTPRGGATENSEVPMTLNRRLELLDISLAEFIRTFPFGERLLDLKAGVDRLLGLKKTKTEEPQVEEQTIQSKMGVGLSVFGAFVTVVSVTMLAMGDSDLFLALDGASLLIAGMATLLLNVEWANILNRGVLAFGLVLGSMHLLTL
mmetsp:Transcript_8094/g.17503  ORF Transcript_8094/g.17503 Transcript_8094/m.17503 type:complete len:209 (+) Transcript_8094:68-694(+)